MCKKMAFALPSAPPLVGAVDSHAWRLPSASSASVVEARAAPFKSLILRSPPLLPPSQQAPRPDPTAPLFWIRVAFNREREQRASLNKQPLRGGRERETLFRSPQAATAAQARPLTRGGRPMLLSYCCFAVRGWPCDRHCFRSAGLPRERERRELPPPLPPRPSRARARPPRARPE